MDFSEDPVNIADELIMILTRLHCLNDLASNLTFVLVSAFFLNSSFQTDFPVIKILDEADVVAKITMPDGIR